MWLKSAESLKKMMDRLFSKSKFTRSVFTLITGTGLAQSLPIALSPFLTRLYTPEDFGVLALYVAIGNIMAILVTGKYELAIVVPKSNSEAINLVVLVLAISCSASAFFLFIILLWGSKVLTFLGYPEILPWMYFIPLTTIAVGCYQALNYWANRCARYKRMATSRVMQSGVSGLVQLTVGLIKPTPFGLMSGQLLGQVISAISLALFLPAKEQRIFRKVSIKRIGWVARKYLKYPKYMVPGQMMSVGATELPVFLLTAVYGAGVAGLYSLAQRVMVMPMSLVAGAVGDVYRQKAAEQYARQGECKDLFISAFKWLGLFAFLPMLPVAVFGPSLFAFVFGENWRSAGEIATLLSILVFFQTVSSPLSFTILLPGWIRFEFYWQTSRLMLTALVFYVCYILRVDYFITISIYVGMFSTMYALHSIWQQRAARGVATVRE